MELCVGGLEIGEVIGGSTGKKDDHTTGLRISQRFA